MSVIRILPDAIANRIAAGEVVERPASVVKELIENAIDAGATRISVQVGQGGRTLIQVSDDGCGMDRDDALLCTEAHATSKIREAADIERISTLGFRGEALPSIASVSRFMLQTRQPDAVAGTEVAIDGGVLKNVGDCGCPPGTTVRVRQLFYNLPARRKFLRSATTEEAHIQEVVLLHALAADGVAFELISDDRCLLQVSGTSDRGVRIAMLLGKEVYSAMLPVDYEEAGIRVHGFAARPGLTRATRREQRFFINRRPASAATVFAGVRDAYHTLIMRGRYAPAVLFLDLPVDEVDVNVHPGKREVRFRNDRLVGQIVAAALRKALRQLAWNSPALPRQAVLAPAAPVSHTPATFAELDGDCALPFPVPVQTFLPVPAVPPDTPEHEASPLRGTHRADPPPSAEPPADNTDFDSLNVNRGSDRCPVSDLNVIGVLSDLYLLAGCETGLVLIDQHAAHERILFEKLLKSAREKDGLSQPLLIPETVELTPTEISLLNKTLKHFVRLGFGLERFGGNTLLVTALPPHFPQANTATLIRDMLDDIQDSPSGVLRQDEISIAKAACKHAVKAQDSLTPVEIRRLLADLAVTEMPYTCPHGRPVMISITFKELEKRFGRRV